MLKLSKEEKNTIKVYNALPASLIEKRIEELKEELLTADQDNFKHIQRFIFELRRWLITIKLIREKKKRKSKKDNCI